MDVKAKRDYDCRLRESPRVMEERYMDVKTKRDYDCRLCVSTREMEAAYGCESKEGL